MLTTIRLFPDRSNDYSNLMEAYVALAHLDGAKSSYRQAIDRKLDSQFLHSEMYLIAFLEADAAGMQRQIEWAGGKPGAEDILRSAQSDTEAFYGHLARARATLRRASESASRNGQEGTAALWLMKSALQEGEAGNFERARHVLQSAWAMAQPGMCRPSLSWPRHTQVIWIERVSRPIN
jgi:hypothetical protein